MPLEIARVTGKVNPLEYDRYLNDGHDPIRLDITKRAVKLQAAMEKACPVHTGKLRATGRKNDGKEGSKPYTDVIFGHEDETPYLGYVLFGTSAHDIYPHQDRPNAHLRFVVGGAIIFAKKVHHPGSRANNFMVRSIPAAASAA